MGWIGLMKEVGQAVPDTGNVARTRHAQPNVQGLCESIFADVRSIC